jgi:hypothetical protein
LFISMAERLTTFVEERPNIAFFGLQRRARIIIIEYLPT